MSKAKGASSRRSQAPERSSAPKPWVSRLTTNWRGVLSEVAFVHKATSLGYMVAKPYGNIHRFDFIVEGSGKLWRVQVKSTTHIGAGLYELHTCCNVHRRLVAYQESDFDFLVAHIVPEDCWYVLPVQVVAGRLGI